jgi:hypothetical protein
MCARIDDVVGSARTVTAVVLAAALSCLPVLLGQCTGSCEAHQAAVTPPCHHVDTAGPQFGRALAGCSHEHAVSEGALRSVFPPQLRALAAIAAAPPSWFPTNCQPSAILSTHAPPGSDGSLHASSLPLRV